MTKWGYNQWKANYNDWKGNQWKGNWDHCSTPSCKAWLRTTKLRSAAKEGKEFICNQCQAPWDLSAYAQSGEHQGQLGNSAQDVLLKYLLEQVDHDKLSKMAEGNPEINNTLAKLLPKPPPTTTTHQQLGKLTKKCADLERKMVWAARVATQSAEKAQRDKN